MTLGYDPDLLPADSESERCAAHSDRIELDPGGSALWVDELIVVDMALPWPKPVWAKDGFTAIPELVMAAGETGRRVRVLAAVPLDDGINRVVTHRLVDGARFARAEHHVDESEVVSLLERLLIDGLDSCADSVVSSASVPEFLLCTQGSHDICCGSRGVAMHLELASVDPSLSVRRVSHTGGHRMAPTGVTVPDGRMWGFVTADEVVAILRREIAPSAVASRCRGWIGVPDGPGQVAERAVLAELDDWSVDHVRRSVTTIPLDDATAVEVGVGDQVWRVEVEAGRAVPTIACGEPGGLPAKPGAEWRVRSISRVG